MVCIETYTLVGMPTTPTDALLAVLLAEYTALKAEQLDRMRTRDNLVYATLAAIGAIGFAAIQAQHYVILLAIPVACAVLGWTRLANDTKVDQIRTYLRDELGPRLHSELTGQPALGWETSSTTSGSPGRKASHLTADLATYVGAPLVAFVLAAPALWEIGVPVLTAAGVIAILAAVAVAPATLAVGIISTRR